LNQDRDAICFDIWVLLGIRTGLFLTNKKLGESRRPDCHREDAQTVRRLTLAVLAGVPVKCSRRCSSSERFR